MSPVFIVTLALTTFFTFLGIGLAAQRWKRGREQENFLLDPSQERALYTEPLPESPLSICVLPPQPEPKAPDSVAGCSLMEREIDAILAAFEERNREVEWL